MPRSSHDDDTDFEFSGPSKSRVKRDMHELQDLGVELVQLPESILGELPMDERLRSALRELKRLTVHGAIKRQKQFIGKLLRNEDTEPLRRALEQRRDGKVKDVKAFKNLERWRDRLMAEDAALDEWIAAYPACNNKPFRALVQNARRERAQTEAGHKPSLRFFRELFQSLRSAHENPAAE